MNCRVLLFLLSLSTAALAQSGPPQYRLNIELIEQSDARSSSSAQTIKRNYEMLVEGNSLGKINASMRVPYTSGPIEDVQVHTIALGNIIECTPRDSDRGVRLDCAIESSYIAPVQHSRQVPIGFPPLIYSRQWKSAVVIPIDQRVLLTAFDDPASQNHMDIYITARKVKP